jgi:hypothetical protein
VLLKLLSSKANAMALPDRDVACAALYGSGFQTLELAFRTLCTQIATTAHQVPAETA